jgi:hypothetical protein
MESKKWLVKFYTSASKGLLLTEVVEDVSWQYAKAKLQSKYAGIDIKSYTPIH